MLKELGLEFLHKTFENENVSMEMLLSMSVDDLKECMKEIGIKRFGDRHKIVEFVLREKRVYGNSMISQTVATVEEPKDHPTIIAELSPQPEPQPQLGC